MKLVPINLTKYQLMMAKEDSNKELTDLQEVTWSSREGVRQGSERRSGQDRRSMGGRRCITVPDMRSGFDRRSGKNKGKVRLVITGRAIDI
jgi:hypothetical protein